MPPRSKNSRENAFVPLLTEVADRVSPRLSEVLEESQTLGLGYGDEVGAMIGAVKSLCDRGGKRLRPALCVAGALCHDAKFNWAPAIEAGVSLELLQAYFLIHDDWMDQDDERRGGPTAHVELGKMFKSKALGERSAILAGDHAVALASAHLAAIKLPASRVVKCSQRFAEMQLAAVAGQQLDIRGKTPDPELTYELKTASYTVRGPLLLGAEMAGAPKKVLSALDAYSLPAGIAFQLRDDLIGVFSGTKVTGKPQGGDLKEGKNTSLVREGQRRLRGRDKDRLKAVFANRRATKSQLTAAVKSLEDCGAREAIEDRITTLVGDALAPLTKAPITPKGRRLLKGAVIALANRKT
jgi:geranylgeranyl diphosphate synthase type I